MGVWRDVPIPNDDYGHPMFKGDIELVNDKNEHLGNVLWFYDNGPFYAHACDLNEPSVIRRIGPCTTLEGAKASVMAVVEGAEGRARSRGVSAMTKPRRFTCDRCGCEVYRPESGPGDDSICLNCWFGRVRGVVSEGVAA